MGPRRLRTMVLLLGAVTAQACGGPGSDVAPPGPAPPTAELAALYRARTDSALARFTAADAEFMTHMIAHHAQGLVMAGLAPERAASPSVLTLAARIGSAQRDEITLMRAWLEDRGLPVPEPRDAGGGDVTADADQTMLSAGMLTPAQMRALRGAAGRDFDSLFLAYMIQHHRGAVTMIHDLFATAGAAQDASVFRIASDVQADQTTEIARMETMLGGRDAAPGPG